MTTLGDSFGEDSSLAKVSQLGWLETPNKGAPSGFIELRMNLRVDYNGSWMNRMSKFWLTLRIVLIRKLLL